MKGVKFYFKCDVCGDTECRPNDVYIDDWNVDECQFKVEMLCNGCDEPQVFDMNFQHSKTRRNKTK